MWATSGHFIGLMRGIMDGKNRDGPGEGTVLSANEDAIIQKAMVARDRND